MKKMNGLLPLILVVLLVSLIFREIMSSGPYNPLLWIGIFAVAMLGVRALRPKNTGNRNDADTTFSLLGDFGKEAFSYDEALNAQFQSAISDFLKSMPKSATKKLENLQPLCKTDADTYAVCVALGMIKCYDDEHEAAIKLFNKAVVLHPTAQLADAIGSAQQRIGELEEAIDSYEFALDLDPDNLNIRAKLATAHVGNADFETAIDQAQQVLDLQEDHASALATIAICHGILGHEDLYQGYTARAVEAGYPEQKITTTVPALKKKYKKTLETKYGV